MSKALSPVGDAPASSREQHISNTFARLNRTQYQSYDAAASSAAHDPGDSDTPQRAPYHVQDSQEVRQVAHILQQQLRLHVPHVVTRIVDAAEYWPMTRTTRKESHHERVAVRAFSSLTASLPGPFLETNPIMGAAFAPVEKVVLRIVGRSQEWCSNPAAGSWSWYELAKRCIADNGEEVVHAGPIVARNEVLQKKYQVNSISHLPSLGNDRKDVTKYTWVSDSRGCELR